MSRPIDIGALHSWTGNEEFATPFALDLDDYQQSGLRVGIFASSGAGKGWLLGCIVEDMIEAGLPVVMLDAEQELWTFKEVGALVIGGVHGDAPFVESAGAIDAVIGFCMDTATPVVFDVGELAEADEVEAFRLGELVMARLMAVSDRRRVETGFACTEAAIFAPQVSERGQARARAMRAIFQRGRKRGLIPVIDTQRMADIQNSLIGQCDVSFVGRINKHLDYAPLKNDVGARGFEQFQSLPVGRFLAMPANEVVDVRARRVTHGGSGPQQGEVTIRERERVGLEQVLALLRAGVPDPPAGAVVARDEVGRGPAPAVRELEAALAGSEERVLRQARAFEAEVGLRQRAEAAAQVAVAELAVLRERSEAADALADALRRLVGVALVVAESGSGLDEGTIRAVVREEVARLPIAGAPTLAPVGALRQRFLETAAERLYERMRSLGDDERETLLFLLAHPDGVTINAVAVGIAGSDSGSTRGRYSTALGALASADLVRVGGSGKMQRYPAVEEWVRAGLSPHEPTPEDLAAVRDRAISLLVVER